MNILSYLDQLAHCSSTLDLAHFKNEGFDYGFEGKVAGSIPKNVLCPKQVHGVELIDASRSSHPEKQEGDAIFTSTKTAVGVVTADCLPVLLAARDGSFVMAVHAGWRGIAQGILLRSVVALKRSLDPKNILVGLGPCISSANYEVGLEVIEAIKKGPLDYSEAELMAVLGKGRNDRWHIDLGIAACLTFAKNGIPASSVGIVRCCTYDNSADWHSFRRDGENAGRNLSWIRRV